MSTDVEQENAGTAIHFRSVILQTDAAEVLALPGVTHAVQLRAAALRDRRRIRLFAPFVTFLVLGLRSHRGHTPLIVPSPTAGVTGIMPGITCRDQAQSPQFGGSALSAFDSIGHLEQLLI